MENKWWEYYVVRYFVGTVVGAIIITFLTGPKGVQYLRGLELTTNTKDVTFLGVGMIAALGFAYCYIASAPILLLHATRAHLRIAISRTNWLWQLIAALAIPAVAVMTACYLVSLRAAIVLGLVVGFQFGLAFLAFCARGTSIEKFYRSLATARAAAARKKDDPTSAGTEYVTSYRHLREHGNAFLILLFEGILAYLFIQQTSFAGAGWLLLIWIFPAGLVWLIGTLLEMRLASTPIP
jgi:uncharacterized membrane-anchored protein YhcB (DUF1043 family)